MTTNTIKIALASDDETSFSSKHFGSAERYIIISYNGTTLIKEPDIINNTEEEKEDGDPEKAKSVSQILKQKDVTIVAGRRFGPNIIRIRKKFLPLVVDITSIENGIEVIKENWQRIINMYNADGQQEHILLQTENGEKVSAEVDQDNCIGCEACVEACPTDAIKMTTKATAIVNRNICVGCSACIDTCMVQAIKLTQ